MSLFRFGLTPGARAISSPSQVSGSVHALSVLSSQGVNGVAEHSDNRRAAPVVEAQVGIKQTALEEPEVKECAEPGQKQPEHQHKTQDRTFVGKTRPRPSVL